MSLIASRYGHLSFFSEMVDICGNEPRIIYTPQRVNFTGVLHYWKCIASPHQIKSIEYVNNGRLAFVAEPYVFNHKHWNVNGLVFGARAFEFFRNRLSIPFNLRKRALYSNAIVAPTREI
ncbi:MAG: hypothetical protein ACI8UO_003005 [Verrucomicrobiales bacterium]|jgi:hypothetical protein